ncbi:MAG: HAD family hydrolase [Halothece sp.]
MLSAILFDLDGTLVNTDPIHFKTWQTVLSDLEMSIDRQFYDSRISGRTNAEIVSDILPHLSLEDGLKVADKKEAQFRELANELTPLPGLKAVLDWTNQNALKQAIVTNAPKANATFMLESLNLKNTFPIVILAEEAPQGKPHPAPYQMALKRLAVSSEKAIAFEDSPSGIKAAVAANIRTFGIASTHDPSALKEAGAEQVFTNFTDASLWDILKG